MKISGIYTALVTPMRGGALDEAAFQSFVDWQVREGVHGLVPVGTTGESPTLTYGEHHRVIELCIEAAGRRVPVMAGTGSNNTEEAISFTRHAKKVGADSALVVAPYYNKPTQEGIYRHYKAIHDAVDIPIVIYNIPGRSVINITDETLVRLAHLPGIAGVKDATGDLARVSTLRHALAREGLLEKMSLLSGEDVTAVAFNAAGGQGCISVTSNIAPRQSAAVQEACLRGDYPAALALHEPLVELHGAMFCETSPGPVKYAASLMGKCSDEVRLPLCEIADASKQRVKAALERLQLV